MRIAVLPGPRAFEVTEAPVPEIAPGRGARRVAACGVCASELECGTGCGRRAFPLYPGHEVSGTVVEWGRRWPSGPATPSGCG